MYNSAYNEIMENLYLGSKQALTFYENFQLIVNCTNEVGFPHGYSGECIRIAVNDDPYECRKMIQSVLESKVLEHIHRYRIDKKSVLVHCFAGMQRSCAVVALYLIKYYDFTPNQCIEFIRIKRPVAFFGGANFLRALEYYYHMTKSQI